MSADTTTLSFFDERPPGTVIDTIVIHSLFEPSFKGSKRFNTDRCIALLSEHKVSAHYIIGRRGACKQLVEEEKRAWHAGVSVLPYPEDKRENVNHFSIGIELVGAPDTPFTESQYRSLTKLLQDLRSRHPIRYIVGHEHIAPGRKSDPGPTFLWERLSVLLGSKVPGIID